MNNNPVGCSNSLASRDDPTKRIGVSDRSVNAGHSLAGEAPNGDHHRATMPPNRRVIGLIIAVVTRSKESNMVDCVSVYANTLESSSLLSLASKDGVAGPESGANRTAHALGSNRSGLGRQ